MIRQALVGHGPTFAQEPDVVKAARRVAFLLGRGTERLEAPKAQKLIEGKSNDSPCRD
jgi:hypothetical protein